MTLFYPTKSVAFMYRNKKRERFASISLSWAKMCTSLCLIVAIVVDVCAHCSLVLILCLSFSLLHINSTNTIVVQMSWRAFTMNPCWKPSHVCICVVIILLCTHIQLPIYGLHNSDMTECLTKSFQCRKHFSSFHFRSASLTRLFKPI